MDTDNIITMWLPDDLFRVILQLDDFNEVNMFFRDLMTEHELYEFASRWMIARMRAEKIPYSRIEKSITTSSKTIARISKLLKNGSGGYQLAIDKINEIGPNKVILERSQFY